MFAQTSAGWPDGMEHCVESVLATADAGMSFQRGCLQRSPRLEGRSDWTVEAALRRDARGLPKNQHPARSKPVASQLQQTDTRSVLSDPSPKQALHGGLSNQSCRMLLPACRSLAFTSRCITVACNLPSMLRGMHTPWFRPHWLQGIP